MNLDDIKKLRQMTGVGMMDAKTALIEAEGNIDKAIEILRLTGAAKAAKKADREARAGLIESYVHDGRIGVLVEINCETDFVARTDDFKAFAKDIAMQVAASSPEHVGPSDIPETVVEKEKALFQAELANQNKPAEVAEQIIHGKLEKYYAEVCLLKQPFIKDPAKSVEDLANELIAKLGENIIIRRFRRLELGGTDG